MVRSALASAAVAALLTPAAAGAITPRWAPPWATVNVCDTAAHPDAIGIRAWMPPLGRRHERRTMRFRVQWRDEGRWRFIGAGGDSGAIDLGPARGRVVETGRLFRFKAPPAGERQLLRGVVTFRWLVRGRVVRTRTVVTTKGHRSSAGSDPKGYSAATCELAGG
ncbi:MAG TPA: hypothetical protein VFR97_15290 [Capillimicrobium sp.]|nr:hypothetical protein [Capillimicrobium sp.]